MRQKNLKKKIRGKETDVPGKRMNNHIKTIMTGVALLCLTASNALAFGDGININGLQINPSVTVTGQHDDNITRSETGQVSSWVAVVSPALDITAGSDINNFTVHYDLERGDYFSSKNDSYTNHFAEVVSHNEFSSRSVLDTAVSYTKATDARGSTFTGIITGFRTRDKWHQTAAIIQYGYGGDSATGRLVIDGSFVSKRYDNHRRLTAGRDLNIGAGGAIFYYRIGSKTSALLEGRYTNYNYRLATSLLDSYELTAYTGLTWEATAKTTGTVKIGVQRKKFRLGTRSANTYPSWDVAIDWSPLTYSTWSLSSGFAAKETDGTGAYTKTNDVNLAWSHEWSTRLSHEASFGYRHDNFVGTVRRDNYYLASISLNYELRSWLDIGAGYNYSKRSSNAAIASYKENVYSVLLSAKL
jgi:hypothetical protein